MRAEAHSQVAMKQVHSSHVNAVGYDSANQILHVTFKSGGTAAYQNVDEEKARLVMNSASIGKAIHQHIRGQHDHEML